MSDPAQILKDFRPSQEFFIGIDSDGCIFDSMSSMHIWASRFASSDVLLVKALRKNGNARAPRLTSSLRAVSRTG